MVCFNVFNSFFFLSFRRLRPIFLASEQERYFIGKGDATELKPGENTRFAVTRDYKRAKFPRSTEWGKAREKRCGNDR